MNKIKFCNLAVLNIKKDNKRIYSRNSRILDYHIGKTYYIHNGNKFLELVVNSRMKGYRFGEFCPTRKQFSHKKK